MLAIRRILHATDFSEHAGHAFRLASALARDYGAELVLLHVSPSFVAYGDGLAGAPAPDLTRRGHARLACLHASDPRVAVERRVVEGDPAPEILRAARESHCDLIVLGTQGLTGLTRLLVGGVAEDVLRKAPCPVLIVKEPPPAISTPASGGSVTAAV
jgi:nucleotide-binding universal stress UspA family protein